MPRVTTTNFDGPVDVSSSELRDNAGVLTVGQSMDQNGDATSRDQITADGRNTQIYLPNGRRTTAHVVEDNADGTVATGDGTVIPAPGGLTTVGVRFTLLTDAVGHTHVYTPVTAVTPKQPGNFTINGNGDMVQAGLSHMAGVTVGHGPHSGPEGWLPRPLSANPGMAMVVYGVAGNTGDGKGINAGSGMGGCACRCEAANTSSIAPSGILPESAICGGMVFSQGIDPHSGVQLLGDEGGTSFVPRENFVIEHGKVFFVVEDADGNIYKYALKDQSRRDPGDLNKHKEDGVWDVRPDNLTLVKGDKDYWREWLSSRVVDDDGKCWTVATLSAQMLFDMIGFAAGVALMFSPTPMTAISGLILALGSGWLFIIHADLLLALLGDRPATIDPELAVWMEKISIVLTWLGALGSLTGGTKSTLDEFAARISKLEKANAKAKAALIEEAAKAGKKISPGDVVHIGKDASGKIVWLETGKGGKGGVGLAHILERDKVKAFAGAGIEEKDIAALVFKAATKGKVVDKMPNGRLIYEVEFGGKVQKVAVDVGSNGFIVGANPVSSR